MKYSQGVKETVARVVPAGGVLADTAYVIGGEILVALSPADATATGIFAKRGLVALAPKAGDVPADGAPCYLDATTHEVQATAGAAVYLCGCRSADHPYDDGTALIGVDLDGTTAAVYGVPGDIQGVTAGTGLTGGGTSGAVTVALSPGSIASLALADAALPAAKIESKTITVALGQTTGASAADADWVGATVIGVVEVSGSDKVRESCAVDGTGAVLLTLAAATTAEATYRVTARLV